MTYRVVAAAAAAALAGHLSTAMAAEIELPPNLSATAYDTTASGYAQSVAIGNMLKKNYGTELRVIPGKNDVSRMLPLKSGQAELCACGIASYFGQEGVFLFAKEDWGPQRIFNLFNAIGRNGNSIVVTQSSGIKTAADLKGKRIAWVRAAPALNIIVEGYLAFAGLTTDDVELVLFPGWGQSQDGVVAGQADVSVVSTVSPHVERINASPHGAFWITLPHDDKEGWERLQAVMPYMTPRMVSQGVAMEQNTSGKVPYEGSGYPYPIFISMNTLPEATAYGLTKAVFEHYDDFSGAPGADGYKLENQDLDWVMPYHPGSIAYYKEIGKWTPEHQANTDALLQRQDLLAEAWANFLATDPAEADFEAKWIAARAEALDKAGLSVPFRNASSD